MCLNNQGWLEFVSSYIFRDFSIKNTNNGQNKSNWDDNRNWNS